MEKASKYNFLKFDFNFPMLDDLFLFDIFCIKDNLAKFTNMLAVDKKLQKLSVLQFLIYTLP
jgi:hypothetical protein